MNDSISTLSSTRVELNSRTGVVDLVLLMFGREQGVRDLCAVGGPVRRQPVPDDSQLRAFIAGRSLAALLRHTLQKRVISGELLTTPPYCFAPMKFLGSLHRNAAVRHELERREPWLKRNWPSDFQSVTAMSTHASIDPALRVLWLRVITSKAPPPPGLIATATLELLATAHREDKTTPQQLVEFARRAGLPPAEGNQNPECLDMWRKRIRLLRRTNRPHDLSPFEILRAVRRVSRNREKRALLALDLPLPLFFIETLVAWLTYRAVHRTQWIDAEWGNGVARQDLPNTALMMDQHEIWKARQRLGLLGCVAEL